MDVQPPPFDHIETAFRLLLEGAPDAILVTDRGGRIVLANAIAAQTFGYPREELLALSVEDLVPARLRARHVEDRERYQRDPQPRYMAERRSLTAVRRDGTELQVEISLIPMETREGLRVTSAVRDVTERIETQQALERQAEELARSNAELEQFAYVASHDLQEPLRMVTSYAQLLARRYQGRLDSDADEFIGFMVDGAKRMQELINDLLAYSRVGTHGKPPTDTDAHRVVQGVLQDLGARIAEQRAEVEVAPLPAVRADAGQLAQVFQNLISNAIKFAGTRTPRVRVSAERAGDRVRFAVRDNGIGIEPQYAERIFLLFQRLHTRRDYPGTGIGLAICKKIVERHGGRIGVESVPGEGSTFHFTLPAASAGSEAAHEHDR